MHVAIVSPYSFAHPGGVQEHTRGLAVALLEDGCEVTLLAPDMGRGAEGLDGILTVSLGRSVGIPGNGSVAPLGIDPRMLPRLELALDPAEVVHLHEPFQPACIAACLRTPSGIPCVGTFHAAAESFLPYAIARPVVRRLAKRLSATTATSAASRRFAQRYAPVDPILVPNGVDVRRIGAATPDPWMAGLGTSVLFVGRNEPRKGHAVAVEAFARAAATRPGVHFVSNVPADQAPDVPPGLADRMHFIGRQPRERLLALFAAADIYMAPNLGRESFGVIILEAMAAGCAVLASDIEGFHAAGGEAITYVPAGDLEAWTRALDGLLDHEGTRTRLAAAGRSRAAEFSWRAVAARMLHVYDLALTVL